MSFGVFGYCRYTQKYASAVFRSGGTITRRQLFLVDNFVYWLWLWNGDTVKWGLPLEQTFEFVYPFVGGSAAAHSFNLVDPTKGRITWVGGVTHDQFGATGNGTSGFGKTGIKFAGNLSGGGAGVTALDTHVIFGCHIYNGVAHDSFNMGNWIQNMPSPPNPPGTLTTSYAGLQARTTGNVATFYNGLPGPSVVLGAVPQAWGFRVSMRYDNNGHIGYYSNTGNTLARVGTNVTTSAQGNEGQWCLLTSGEDDVTFNPHTMMGAFLTKSIRGSSNTYGYVYTDAKMNEIWNDFFTFNKYLGREAV